MRAIVTGACGFAGRYMCDELEAAGYEVVKTDIVRSLGVIGLDITNSECVLQTIEEIQPDIIYNLAGSASVAGSWNAPQKAVELNVTGALNILEAVRKVSDKTRVVLIGSSEEYGRADSADITVDESYPLNPVSPYAVSKRCQEDMGLTYSMVHKLNVCMTRSFNHIGVGQADGFVVSDFARGIAQVEKGKAESLRVGNLNSLRCFSDVRDIVRAYRLIGEKGASGRIYNVGSGRVYSIEKILSILISFADCNIPVESDQSKLRCYDTPCFICNSSLLNRDTGWREERNIEDTLLEILNYYRKTV